MKYYIKNKDAFDMPSYKQVFLFLFVFFLLVGSSLKDDSGGIINTLYWSDLLRHPLVNWIRSISWYLTFFAIVLGCMFLAGMNFKRLRFNLLCLIFMFVWFLFLIRFLLGSYSSFVNHFFSFLLASFVFLVLSISSANFGDLLTKKIVAYSFFYFSIFFVILNYVGLLVGYGFVPGNPRFFGTSSHPNFIGVQLGFCNILLANFLLQCRFSMRYFRSSIIFLILMFGVYLQLLTGSRTSFVLLFFGLIFLLYGRISGIKFITLSILTSFVGFILFLFFSDHYLFGDALYRGEGGGDTRSEAWSSMWGLIVENPFFGLGHFYGFSESSYLRAMVVFGIPIGLMFIVSVAFLLMSAFRQDDNYFDSNDFKSLYLALSVGCFVGAVFEGYLLDAWSYQKLIFIFLIGLSFKSRKAGFLDR